MSIHLPACPVPNVEFEVITSKEGSVEFFYMLIFFYSYLWCTFCRRKIGYIFKGIKVTAFGQRLMNKIIRIDS